MSHDRCQTYRSTFTEHRCYCALERDHEKPCSLSDGNGVHVWLDGYEMANLRTMLLAIDEIPELKRVLDTGDWIWQIRNKLRLDTRNPPNKTVEQLKAEYERVVRDRQELAEAVANSARHPS